MKTNARIVLASASPRRHELLELAGIAHEIIVPCADESAVTYTAGHPEEYVQAISLIKNEAVASRLEKEGFTSADDIVIVSADTIVHCPGNDLPLGKPKDEKDAFEMLRMLSGSTHSVITGVTIAKLGDSRPDTFFSKTLVTFRDLDDSEISGYIKTGEPMDKAGSYGIQGGACSFVERIEGDYYNVVGLPVCEIVLRLKAYGIFQVYEQESRCLN